MCVYISIYLYLYLYIYIYIRNMRVILKAATVLEALCKEAFGQQGELPEADEVSPSEPEESKLLRPPPRL